MVGFCILGGWFLYGSVLVFVRWVPVLVLWIFGFWVGFRWLGFGF